MEKYARLLNMAPQNRSLATKRLNSEIDFTKHSLQFLLKKLRSGVYGSPITCSSPESICHDNL